MNDQEIDDFRCHILGHQAHSGSFRIKDIEKCQPPMKYRIFDPKKNENRNEKHNMGTHRSMGYVSLAFNKSLNVNCKMINYL